jgi:hypothetical protein
MSPFKKKKNPKNVICHNIHAKWKCDMFIQKNVGLPCRQLCLFLFFLFLTKKKKCVVEIGLHRISGCRLPIAYWLLVTSGKIFILSVNWTEFWSLVLPKNMSNKHLYSSKNIYFGPTNNLFFWPIKIGLAQYKSPLLTDLIAWHLTDLINWLFSVRW